jgi:glycosyltransferase involved in cell wall biosynthesis
VPAVSFVVPAYNEAANLGATLAAIHDAARALALDYEIVVADDASTDATASIAREAGARVVACSCRQIAATRNAGARAALGQRLVFVDADTRVDAAVVAAAMRAMDRGAVGGSATVRFPPGSPWWAHAMVAWTMAIIRVGRLAAGCFVFCARPAFEAVGGFDERYFGGEEWVLAAALKRKGRFVVLGESVLTSARKVEGRSAWALVKIFAGVVARGPRGLRDRRNCGFWYDR